MKTYEIKYKSKYYPFEGTRKKEDIVKLEFVEEILLKHNFKYYETSNISKK